MPIVLDIPKQPGQAHRCNLFRNRGIKFSHIINGSIPLILRFLLLMVPKEEASRFLIGNSEILAFLVEIFWGHVGEK